MHYATKNFGKGLINEQEVLNNIAEMMMETYVSESLALRVEKLSTIRGDVSVYKDMLDVNLFETAGIVRSSALEAIASFSSPEIYPVLVQAIEKLTREEFVNVKEARRHIAEKLIEDNSYKF
jgi:HEAT repeat protein